MQVIYIFSSTGGVKPSQFNPQPSKEINRNFCILAEQAEGIEDSMTGKLGRISGTSVATSIAVAIAARIIDSSRHKDYKPRFKMKEREALKRADGMRRSFE
jgi:hypothetical protein